jgi:hypothetical protein
MITNLEELNVDGIKYEKAGEAWDNEAFRK